MQETHLTSSSETPETAAPKKIEHPGNRAQRRMLAAIARRIKNRPGRGYTKRSAAQDQIPARKSEHLKLIKSMQQNAQIIELVASGAFDKHLDRDYGPELAKKYRAKK